MREESKIKGKRGLPTHGYKSNSGLLFTYWKPFAELNFLFAMKQVCFCICELQKTTVTTGLVLHAT